MRLTCPNCSQEISLVVAKTERSRDLVRSNDAGSLRAVRAFSMTLGVGRWSNAGLRSQYDDWCSKHNGPELTAQQLSTNLDALGLTKWRSGNTRGFLVTQEWREQMEHLAAVSDTIDDQEPQAGSTTQEV